jgi:RNA polymerase sigma-70 factor, ECF subfamily
VLLTDATAEERLGVDGSLKLSPTRTEADRMRAPVKKAQRCSGSLWEWAAGKLTLMAAINVLHDEAAAWEDTDWRRIVGLFDHLLRIWATSPRHLPYLAARADCLRALGGHSESKVLYEEAILLTDNDVERAFLTKQTHLLSR